ncbi:MAG: metallophosphoesterase [Ardenticatenaceae bacterium]|nr:metallophosphoesterase [Anaerolineales bacterium]MCB8922717.1 metallophosphoesterase [Ardenticatenaceae bacterium]MCB9003578.1 metallophosphoesterase [Ardenticatenaceae bacterium]
MNILALSDRVLDWVYSTQVRENYPNVDLIIGCGDLPFYYLDFLVSALDKPLVYVCGNHDQTPQYTADGRTLTHVQGGLDLHGMTAVIHDTLFAGLEGSIRYRPGARLMYDEAEMRFQISRLLPGLLRNRVMYGRFLDILVAHSPPFGIHDRPDPAHTGFKAFLPFLRIFKPRYMLHGHIHLYRQDAIRQTQFEQTTIINVYPLYKLAYKA